MWTCFIAAGPALADARHRARRHLSRRLHADRSGRVSAIYGLLSACSSTAPSGSSDLPSIFIDSARSTGAILFILSGALFVGMVATLAGIPDAIVNAIKALDLSALGFLFLVNAVLLVLGCFLDGFTLLTVVTPLLLPTVKALDINLIHFCIVLTLNIEIAAITPPVGLNLFVITGISGTTMHEVARGAFPFVLALHGGADTGRSVPVDRARSAVEELPWNPIVDAHHHIWRQADQPWLQGPAVPRIFGAYDAFKRDYPVEEFVDDLERHRRGQVGLCADQLGQEGAVEEVEWVQENRGRAPAGRTPSSPSSTPPQSRERRARDGGAGQGFAADARRAPAAALARPTRSTASRRRRTR